MSELKSYVCPNCGANTSNLQNCEYCGSLLVRLISKELSIEESVFGDQVYVIPGLEQALEENLLIQKSLTPNQTVITTIQDQYGTTFQVVPTSDVSLGTERQSPFSTAENPSIALRMSFIVNSMDENEASQARVAYRNFKALTISQLFTEQQWQYGSDYYIDFGKDVHNAAHICTKIAETVAGWGTTTPISCYSELIKKEQIMRVSKEGLWSKRNIILASIVLIILYILIMVL